MTSRDYLEVTFKSINCFADDGKLDAEELDSLLSVAMRDGVVDEDEKRVLKNIIARVRKEEIDRPLARKIKEVEDLISED